MWKTQRVDRDSIFLDETRNCMRVNCEESASAAKNKSSLHAPAKHLSAERPWQRIFRKSRVDKLEIRMICK